MIGNIGEHILGHQMRRADRERSATATSRASRACTSARRADEWVAISAGSDAEFAALVRRHRPPRTRARRSLRRRRLAPPPPRRTRRDHRRLDARPLAGRRRARAAGRRRLSRARAEDPAPDGERTPARPRLLGDASPTADAGTWDMEGPVWRMSRTPAHIRLPAPMFGEHNHVGARRPARPDRRRDRRARRRRRHRPRAKPRRPFVSDAVDTRPQESSCSRRTRRCPRRGVP